MIYYVDGSYDKRTRRYGYGVVVVNKDGEAVATISGGGIDTDGVWNIAGELEAATRAIKYAKKTGDDKIVICYDYEGIRSWANGTWKAKKEVSQRYVQAVKESGLKITFEKVKSHSGVKYNELADRLAGEGVRISNAGNNAYIREESIR